ncbi:hypothetical protein B9G69_009060 [Bdellovibrio sp. SKB1291214]|uniref:hypothetical protein n=1 Tax=Bdellovibrio sp. SKB1291214 TaxID=1732569 RepID=UPI000B51B684|nr:hypothetical protein [Bdellovibrio sp. SKB1291214]UYL10723.1 hypothetical protein B9G69_009060 [Bdellovibrio sp. SKB1291214]
MKKILIILVGLFVLSSLEAQADILFLDLNGNPKEIEAAKAAASKRGEQVIVIPEVTKELATKQAELLAKTQKANEDYLRKGCSSGNANSAACSGVSKALNDAMANENEFRQKNQLNPETLDKALRGLKSQGVNLSSLVVSGHDGNGHFGGTFGDLTDKNLAEAFQKNAPLGDSIRSLALWGCYTANLSSLSLYWKKAFPQVEVVVGFDKKGPLGNSPANWALLKDFLSKEKDLAQIKDQNELQKAFKKLEGVRITDAAICVGNNFSNKFATMDVANIQSMCEGAFLKDAKIYTCYLNAEKGCENPPANTSSSDLRRFYEQLQDYAHCKEVLPPEQQVGMPSADTMIRLIHFADVKKNFVQNFSQQIGEYNKLLDKVGAPKNLQWGDILKMSRAEILEKLKATDTYFDNKGTGDSALNPEFMALKNFVRLGVQPILGDLNVPFTWVEKGAGPGEGMKNGMATASEANVIRLRKDYENERASRLMNQKIDEVLKTNSATKSQMDAITIREQEIQKQMEAGVNFRDIMGPAQKIDEDKLKLRQNNWQAISGELEQYKRQLKSSEYASAEGQKIFNSRLDELMASYNKTK